LESTAATGHLKVETSGLCIIYSHLFSSLTVLR